MAALHAGEHLALAVAHADMRGAAIDLLLGDVVVAVLAAADIVGAAHAGPLPDILTLRGEDLDAPVGAVGDVELARIVEGDAVRQVKLPRPLARRAPGGYQPAGRGETVHPGVAVAVGDIDVAVRVTDHLGRVVERAGGALDEPVLDLAGVGMDAGGAELQLHLAVGGKGLRHRVGAARRVDRVADDLEAVRV